MLTDETVYTRKVKQLRVNKNISIDQCIKNKNLRDDIVSYIRKNSIMTRNKTGTTIVNQK